MTARRAIRPVPREGPDIGETEARAGWCNEVHAKAMRDDRAPP